MRKTMVAGNWKMNLEKQEALALYEGLKGIDIKKDREVVVFSPYIYLDTLIQHQNQVKIGAQNFYPAENGAYTGEVSVSQLKNLGITHVLVGHSERRMYFDESNELVKLKVDMALQQGLKVVYCCGEPLDVREARKELHYVYKQLESSLFHLTEEQMEHITIAYEPIWAIGTGKTASIEQAEEMHRNLRIGFHDRFGAAVADKITILYGGSCNASNAEALFACENIDGGLIGGASLKLEDFISIIQA